MRARSTLTTVARRGVDDEVLDAVVERGEAPLQRRACGAAQRHLAAVAALGPQVAGWARSRAGGAVEVVEGRHAEAAAHVARRAPPRASPRRSSRCRCCARRTASSSSRRTLASSCWPFQVLVHGDEGGVGVAPVLRERVSGCTVLRARVSAPSTTAPCAMANSLIHEAWSWRVSKRAGMLAVDTRACRARRPRRGGSPTSAANCADDGQARAGEGLVVAVVGRGAVGGRAESKRVRERDTNASSASVSPGPHPVRGVEVREGVLVADRGPGRSRRARELVALCASTLRTPAESEKVRGIVGGRDAGRGAPVVVGSVARVGEQVRHGLAAREDLDHAAASRPSRRGSTAGPSPPRCARSCRAECSRSRWCPTVAEPTRRPSTSTSVCARARAADEDALRLARRRRWRAARRPARRCSTSASESGPAASSSARVITSRRAASAAGCRPRVAVTTTGSSGRERRWGRPGPARPGRRGQRGPRAAAFHGESFAERRASPQAAGLRSDRGSRTGLVLRTRGRRAVAMLAYRCGGSAGFHRLPVHPFAAPSYARAARARSK